MGWGEETKTFTIRHENVTSQVINIDQETQKHWRLTPEGDQVVELGSHEVRVYNDVPVEGGILQADLMVGCKSFSSSISRLFADQ